jgi:hypothetical protein
MMSTLNLKAVASAFAALALTVMLSWTFVDATGIKLVQRGDSDTGIAATISSLVR